MERPDNIRAANRVWRRCGHPPPRRSPNTPPKFHTWVLVCRHAVAHRPQARCKRVFLTQGTPVSSAVRLLLLLLLTGGRGAAHWRRRVEVDVDVDAGQLRRPRRGGDLDTRQPDVLQHVRVEDVLRVWRHRVDRDVADAVPAERAGAAARHGELAAQSAALVELGKGALVGAVADKVQGGDVLAQAVEPEPKKNNETSSSTGA